MLNFLPGPVKGGVLAVLFLANTVFWCCPLFVAAFFKFIIPIGGWRKLCNVILIGISTSWISCNNLFMNFMNKVNYEVKGIDNLEMNDWYLVLSNHQTWVDIPVMQKVFNRRIPFLKFFLKKGLIWVPFLGLAWWALDFPFMKRYTKEFLKKNPHLKGKDLETTKKACEKFKTMPVSVMNFVEGTRFTPEKHAKQESPHKHLLKPRAAGMAFVLAAMGGQMSSILDVTIVYPGGPKGLWDYLCGRISEIRVDVKSTPVTGDIMGDYFGDEQFRAAFQEWLNDFWAEKDKRIDSMLA